MKLIATPFVRLERSKETWGMVIKNHSDLPFWDHSDHSIVVIGQNTEKSPGD